MAAPLPPLPIPTEPVIDPRTGLMTRSWYQYFRALDGVIRELTAP